MSSQNIDTRTRILEAARHLLEAQQGHGVRMSDIAKAAGVSRQAVYLHFETRLDLLIATTLHVDATNRVDDRLVASRTAPNGRARLSAFIDAWGNYIPEIYGIARALMAMQESDPEAKKAWGNRMQAVRHGCAAAVKALDDDGDLSPELTVKAATDLLWTLLSVRNWEHLRLDCGWSQKRYVTTMQRTAEKSLMG